MSENTMPNEQKPEEVAAPEKGEDVIADYYDNMKELEKIGYESGIRKARNALLVTAGLLLLGEIIAASAAGVEVTPLLIGIIAVEVGVFVSLAFWTKKKPFSAIIIGIILFVLLWGLSVYLAEGVSKASGLVVRIIILVNLVQALKPAKAWEDLHKR